MLSVPSRFSRVAGWPVVAMLSGVLFASLAACSAETGDIEEGPLDGDSNVSEDELVSEVQLNGSGMAQKHIALTFDDGPGGRSAELANYLGDQAIPAAFFINGKNVPGRQTVIDTIVGRGHTLANHTQNHEQMTRLSGTPLFKAVADTDEIMKRAQPSGPFMLRAPYGAWNGRVADELNRTDMKKYVGSIFWDVGGALTSTAAADWDCWGKSVSVQRCADLYLQEIRTKKRGIVLMHDVHSKTVDMVKLMVPVLKAEGYIFDKTEDAPAVKRAITNVSTPPAPMTFPKGCTVTEDSTNVRAAPEGTIINKLNRGASVQATSARGSWYAVTFRLGGTDWGTANNPAFVHSSLLSCR
jgi:peptidoglycan/xylan/chitin deacetylase (PgdA/CDA1 family)